MKYEHSQVPAGGGKISIRDGRTFTAQIGDSALARQDTWKYLRDIDEAFRSLSRRKQQRVQ